MSLIAQDINFHILALLLILTLLWGIGGDYLYERGLVKSIYIGSFHLQHEYAYLLIPIYLIWVLIK